MKQLIKILAIVFTVVIALIVGLIALVGIGADQADKAIKNDSANARADIDIRCGTSSQFGTYGFVWHITNSASKAQDYVADVALYDAKGNQLGTLTILQNAVTPGSKVTGAEYLDAGSKVPTKCTVVTATAFEVG